MNKIDNLAVQMYSLRNMEGSLASVLRQVAEAGYAGIETVGNHDLSAHEMNALLKEHDLKVCSSHVPLEALEEDVAGVCRFNREVGNDTVVVPWIAPDARGSTKEPWQGLGRRLGGLSRQVEAEGLKLLYHNHDFEMQTVDGKLALDWLIDGAGDAPLGLELDLGWVALSGQDSLKLLRRYAPRVARVHVKDLAPEGENADEDGWSDVGHGTLDWSSLLPAAREAGTEWFVVEHDNPSDGARFLRRSAAFLRDAL